MKKLFAFFLIFLAVSVYADETTRFEYATIHWDGDNTYVLLPSGKVDFIGKQLKTMTRPDKVDERAFYLHIAINSLGDKGYDFAGMSNDGNNVVMKRQTTPKIKS